MKKVTLFSVKVLILALCLLLISSYALKSNLDSSSSLKSCKNSFQFYGIHLVKEAPLDSALKCIKYLKDNHQISLNVSKKRDELFWRNYFLKKENSLFMYNKFLIECRYKDLKKNKKTCEEYQSFFSEAYDKGDVSLMHEIIWNETYFNDNDLNDIFANNVLSKSLVESEEIFALEKFNISYSYPDPESCSHFNTLKDFDYKKLKERFHQGLFLFSMFWCSSDADDIFTFKLSKDILNFLNFDDPNLSHEETLLIANLAYLLLDNSGPDLKRLEQIVLDRTGLEALSTDFVNTYLDNMYSIPPSTRNILNWISGDGVSIMYLNFAELYLNESYYHPYDFNDDRKQFIDVFNKFSPDYVNNYIYNDSSMQLLSLQRLNGTESCDLSSNFMDKAIKIYEEYNWSDSQGLSQAENIALLANCFLESRKILLKEEDWDSATDVYFSELEKEDLEKANFYNVQAEKVYKNVNEQHKSIILETFLEFTNLRIRFYKDDVVNHLEDLNLIFQNFLENEKDIKNILGRVF